MAIKRKKIEGREQGQEKKKWTNLSLRIETLEELKLLANLETRGPSIIVSRLVKSYFTSRAKLMGMSYEEFKDHLKEDENEK